MTKFFAIAVLSAIIAGSVAIVDRQTGRIAPAEGPVDESTATARIYAAGIVEGRAEDIELRLELPGRVTEVCVQEGDWVEAGRVLVRLDDRRERQQVAASLAKVQLAQANLERLINGARDSERQEARALLTASQARLDQARVALNRINSLRLRDAVSQQEADDKTSEVHALTAEAAAAHARLEQLEAPAREDDVRAAQAEVAAAQADHELAAIILQKTELRAPSAGQVLDIRIEPGELVTEELREPALVLADTGQLRVRAFVEEIDAPRIALGATALVTADGIPGQTFSAVVSELSPQMKVKTMSTGQPDELYDTKVREVLLDVADGQTAVPLIVGLRVDVVVDAAAPPPTSGAVGLETLQEPAA